MEEAPRKNIEDLNLEEALAVVDKIKLRKKQIDAAIAAFRDKKNTLKTDKARLKADKSKKLKSLQEVINKTVNKTSKDSKRKSKVRESDSFDSRIASKEREIESLEKSISGLDLEKKQIAVGEERLKQHIKKLK